tara:strand:+ start:289 stop:567 length:279 start_codon:yes stop_codon:yes gene_type:complete
MARAWSAIFNTNSKIQHGDAGRQPLIDGASHGAAMFKASVSGRPFKLLVSPPRNDGWCVSKSGMAPSGLLKTRTSTTSYVALSDFILTRSRK